MSTVPVPTSVRNDPAGNAPLVLDEIAVSADEHRTLAGQTRAHVTHFAAAHRVGLPGERERPAARRQIAPVARCRLQIALVFQVPWVLWLSPIVQQLIQFSASPIQRAAVRISSSAMPVISATLSGGYSLEEARHRLPALGVLGDELLVDVPVLDDQMQQPVEQGEVGAGRIGRNRSALSAVAVRRGSTTISLAPALTAPSSAGTGSDGSRPCSRR